MGATSEIIIFEKVETQVKSTIYKSMIQSVYYCMDGNNLGPQHQQRKSNYKVSTIDAQGTSWSIGLFQYYKMFSNDPVYFQ